MNIKWKNLDTFLNWWKNIDNDEVYKVSDVDKGYKYWKNYLTDIIMDLIDIQNTPTSLPGKEILYHIIYESHSLIFNHPRFNLITTYSSLYDYDINGHYLNANIYNPSREFYVGFSPRPLTIGKDCTVIYAGDMESYINRGGCNKLYSLICRYARMLADVESSIDLYLINSRSPYVFTAKNQQIKDSLIGLFRGITKGQQNVIVDDDILGESKSLKNIDLTPGMLAELLDSREKILKQFLQQLGIYSTDDKSERLITAEVEQENRNVKPFIYSLLKSINEGLEQTNNLFGTNMKAKLNEYVYNKEVEVDENL